MKAPERPEYAETLILLEELLAGWPQKVVVIDGKPCAGKTTLGRFLAWRLSVSLLETDLFLKRNQGRYLYNEEALKVVIDYLEQKDRPVIIEGVVALQLLRKLDVQPDFHIHVICEKESELEELAGFEKYNGFEEYAKYCSEFQPKKHADHVLDLPKLLRT